MKDYHLLRNKNLIKNIGHKLEAYMRGKPETYSQPSQTSKMEVFIKIVNGFQPFTVFIKSSILDIWLGYEYAFGDQAYSLKLKTTALRRTDIGYIYNYIPCETVNCLVWQKRTKFNLPNIIKSEA